MRSKVWGDVSEDAKHLVSRLLEPDPAARLSIQDALQHPWIKAIAHFLLPHPLLAKHSPPLWIYIRIDITWLGHLCWTPFTTLSLHGPPSVRATDSFIHLHVFSRIQKFCRGIIVKNKAYTSQVEERSPIFYFLYERDRLVPDSETKIPLPE